MLAPLLAPGFRAASKLGRTIGAALFLGPIVLGLSIVFVLAPRAVFDNVVRYRSISGYFGRPGFLRSVRLGSLSSTYDRSSPSAGRRVCVLFRAAWRRTA